MKHVLLALITFASTAVFALPEESLNTDQQLKGLVKGSIEYKFKDSVGALESDPDAVWLLSTHLLIDDLRRRNTCDQSEENDSLEHCMLSLMKTDKSYGLIIRYTIEDGETLVSMDKSEMIFGPGQISLLTFTKKKKK